MKEVTRCSECVNRVHDLGVGFIPNTRLICSMIGCEVEFDDGCTFGEVGDGGYATRECEIILDGHAAVNGYYEYCCQ